MLPGATAGLQKAGTGTGVLGQGWLGNAAGAAVDECKPMLIGVIAGWSRRVAVRAQDIFLNDQKCARTGIPVRQEAIVKWSSKMARNPTEDRCLLRSAAASARTDAFSNSA